jgi:hypothetical protein
MRRFIHQLAAVVLAVHIDKKRSKLPQLAHGDRDAADTADILPVRVSRRETRIPPSSGSMPFSRHQSAAASDEKTAVTPAPSAPVRISSRDTLAPVTALSASITMDFPRRSRP